MINYYENKDENEKKDTSQGYNVNIPRSAHGHKYSNYKKCLGMMILCIKQHLSDI